MVVEPDMSTEVFLSAQDFANITNLHKKIVS